MGRARRQAHRQPPAAKEMGTCRLCLQTAVLCYSHVFPEWGYRWLYDKNHRYLELAGAPGTRVKLKQKGINEPLLCKKCEGKLSKYERYAKALLTKPGRLTLPTPTAEQVMNQADYAKLRLFQLSLLWRAHISSEALFRKVVLAADDAERIRVMLNAEDPGAPDEYPCALLAGFFDGDFLRYFMLPPNGHPDEEHGHWRFVLFFAGFAWQYLVTWGVDDVVTRCAIQMDGSFPVGYWNLAESPNWLEAARQTALRNRLEVERLFAKKSKAKKGKP